MSDLRAIACGPAGIYGITVRTCHGCGATCEHISQWQGPYFGYDHHCLACGVTDKEGSLTPLTEDNEPYWLHIAERYVLPAGLFARYVAAAERMVSDRLNQTATAERYSYSLLGAVAAEVRAFHAAADARDDATPDRRPTGREVYEEHGWSGCAGSAWETLTQATRDGWEHAARLSPASAASPAASSAATSAYDELRNSLTELADGLHDDNIEHRLRDLVARHP